MTAHWLDGMPAIPLALEWVREQALTDGVDLGEWA